MVFGGMNDKEKEKRMAKSHSAEMMSSSQADSGIVKEGQAHILSGGPEGEGVFYNPVQIFNRDLSILAIRAFAILREKEERRRTQACPFKTGSQRGQKAEQRNGPMDGCSSQDSSIGDSGHNASDVNGAAPTSSNDSEAGETARSESPPGATVTVNAETSMLPSDTVNPSPPLVPPIKLKLLEPLAATGLRSIRYALELDDVIELVVAGDMDVSAVELMEKNRDRNRISKDRLRVVCSDANQLMYFCRYAGIDATSAFTLPELTSNGESLERRTVTVPIATRPIHQASQLFDVIDLDPYGSVAGFLDAAVQAVADGGLLCLTSTDMQILCGNNPEVSYYKYGGTAVKARYMHEMSLRLLINAVAVAAARYRRTVEPLLCCSVDFYVRCFVRITVSPAGCKLLASKTALALQCTNCDAFVTVPLGLVQRPGEEKDEKKAPYQFKVPQMPRDLGPCQQCGSDRMWIAGPFYAAPLYHREFLDTCVSLLPKASDDADPINSRISNLKMLPKIRGLLTAIDEEDWAVPLHYHLPSLMNSAKLEAMKTVKFKSALLHLGYRVSHFHREPQSIKTNATATVVFDIIRKWAEEHPPKNPDAFAILRKFITTDSIQFDVHPDAVASKTVSRWLPNPAPRWGPKAKPKRLAQDMTGTGQAQNEQHVQKKQKI